MLGIVTRFDMYTNPVHDIWYTVSVYSAEHAEACIDAFTAWQRDSSDLNSTVAFIIGLDTITVGFLYAKIEVPPGVFSAFDALPEPLAVAVPPTIGTIHSLTQILASTSSSDPMR
jgi:hypothetical protein